MKESAHLDHLRALQKRIQVLENRLAQNIEKAAPIVDNLLLIDSLQAELAHVGTELIEALNYIAELLVEDDTKVDRRKKI